MLYTGNVDKYLLFDWCLVDSPVQLLILKTDYFDTNL